MKFVSFLFLSLSLLSMSAFGQREIPSDGRIDIWPTIPFIRGADLCKYKDAYSRTRSEYMSDMVRLAGDLMNTGAKGKEALQMLTTFNALYDQNQAVAIRHQYLDVTLESTLKSYLDGYYRQLRPRVKKMSFTHVNDIFSIVRAATNGQRDGYLDGNMLAKLDFIAYGTYALAPNCQGNIQVTIHMIGRNGMSESFLGQGPPSVVMSQIASQMFEAYQRTSFPSKVRMGNSTITLVGGLNGSVDEVSAPELAEEACRLLDARLPNRLELEMLDSYGDWSGGVSLNDRVWAMPNNMVYHPGLRNPTPVRSRREVNENTFLYYCVR